MHFFLELVTQTEQARRDFSTHPAVLDAVANGMPVERYRKLLLELYHVVWHFNPICAAAASRLPDEHRELRYFLYTHMDEEKGHEQWVLQDLEAIGFDPSEAARHTPSVHTLAMLGYNYWAADRRHPNSVFGMLYALEVMASVYGGPFSTALTERLFLQDSRGVSFLSSHATLDAEHMADLRKVLDPLSDDSSRQAIIESTNVNFHHFERLLENT